MRKRHGTGGEGAGGGHRVISISHLLRTESRSRSLGPCAAAEEEGWERGEKKNNTVLGVSATG